MDIREAISQRNLGYENRKLCADITQPLMRQPEFFTPELVRQATTFALHGPLYHSARSIETLLWAAAEKLPDTTLAPELCPTKDGVWVFTDARVQSSGEFVQGLSWFSVGDKQLVVSILKRIPQYGIWPTEYLPWPFGHTIPSAIEWMNRIGQAPVDSYCDQDLMIGFLLTAFLFVKQRLVQFASHRPDRAQRKWATALELPDSDVRIVQLRQKQYERKEGEPEEVEWSCHWLVRGHWRAQYHRSTDTHEPLWILPHLKGDFDKPFKAPTETAFAVTR